MKPFRLFPLALMLLAAFPAFALDYYQQQLQNERLLQHQVEQQKRLEQVRYRRQVGDKALSGITNMVSGPLELPKNIINLYNDPDGGLIFGVIGGLVRGPLDAAARITNGISDLVTAPLPTKPVVRPEYVWDDFDQTNTYGKIFRLVDNPPIVVPPPVALRPTAIQTPVDDRTEQYSRETNRNLDTLFRKEMMK